MTCRCGWLSYAPSPAAWAGLVQVRTGAWCDCECPPPHPPAPSTQTMSSLTISLDMRVFNPARTALVRDAPACSAWAVELRVDFSSHGAARVYLHDPVAPARRTATGRGRCGSLRWPSSQPSSGAGRLAPGDGGRGCLRSWRVLARVRVCVAAAVCTHHPTLFRCTGRCDGATNAGSEDRRISSLR